MPPVTRRGFLLAGAGVVLGAACSRDGGREAGTTTTREPPLSLVLGSFQTLTGPEQRIAFGVVRGNEPIRVTEGASVAFAPPDGDFGEVTSLVRKDDGIELRPLYVTRHTFPTAGAWRARAIVGDQRAEAAINVVDPASSKIPVPGSPVPAIATPTTAEARGVDPICTRQPPCPWHDVSLDAAVKEGRPLAVLIATPALCQSAVCGPVLDILLGLRQDFEPKVHFLHLEVFTDTTGQTTTPAVQGFKLDNEPFLFFAGPDGKVADRIDGPFDRSEAAEFLTRLTH